MPYCKPMPPDHPAADLLRLKQYRHRSCIARWRPALWSH